MFPSLFNHCFSELIGRCAGCAELKPLQCLSSTTIGSPQIDTKNHASRIPPSLTITRYLHGYAQQKAVQLVGPMYLGDSIFSGPVIFIDGGTQFRKHGEGLSVGDGDSYRGQLDEKLNPNKDYSDLSYVLASLPAHFNEAHLYGFLGGRRDHEWANLGEANAFLKKRHQAMQLHFETEITGFTAGRWQLEINELFSLLCLETAKVKLTGDCQFQLKQKTPLEPLCSHGLSNVGQGVITLQTDKPIFIIYPGRI